MGDYERLERLKAFVVSQGWNCRQGKEIPHGKQLIISDSSDEIRVNYWPKNSKIQVQGKDGALKNRLQCWIGDRQPSPESLDDLVVTSPHIGMDESGKGDWFGSIVVAGVYVDQSSATALQTVGVRDSKKIANQKIEQIASEIRKIIPKEKRIVYVSSPSEYNQFYKQHKNLNTLLAALYAKAATILWQRNGQPSILCDQFAFEKDTLTQAFANQKLPPPQQQHHAEEVSVAVAAASILARAAFLRSLSELGEELGLSTPLPLGASNIAALTELAQRIIQNRGVNALEQFAKLNFAPVQRLLADEHKPDASPEIHHSDSINIELPITWQIQHYEQGYWRFQFADGGILDWWADHNGKFDVRGQKSAVSYQVLIKRAHGTQMKPRNRDDAKSLLEKLEERLRELLPPQQVSLRTVLGIGWHRSSQLYGTRFSFTDGTVLQYYANTKRLLIQGCPSPPLRKILQQLPSPFWIGLDKLTTYLTQLFPDWELGTAQFYKEKQEEMNSSQMAWEPPINALDWQKLWSTNQEFRQAASGREEAPCQKAFLDDWASVLIHHHGFRALLAQAPTGLGKTLSALVPALAWVAENPNRRRIYYLVNRVAQHENPIRELRRELAEMFHHNTEQTLRVVDLVGRSQLCIDPNARKIAKVCQQSRDQAAFDRLPEEICSWQEIQAHFHGQDVCPYHFLQGLMSKAHIVICDYWWLFSETAQQSKLLNISGVSRSNSILIVDEAHNLPLRVRAELDVDATFEELLSHIHYATPELKRCLEPVVQHIQNSLCNEGISPSILLTLAGGKSAVQSILNSLTDDENSERQSSLSERLVRLLLKPDPEVIFYRTTDVDRNDRLVCKLINPTPVLSRGYGLVHASLTMSGTLAAPTDDANELQYQIPLFGLPEQTLTRRYLSPFPPRNQQWIYVPDTYGTYNERGKYIPRYVQHITEIGQATPGVTAVFFNSYQFLQQVRDAISDENERALIVTEQQSNSEADELSGKSLESYRTELEQIVQQHQRAYLFAIYQGKIAEGANFPGNLIKTVVCLSVPLEYPGLFHKKLQERYQELLQPIATQLRQDIEQKAEEYAIRRLALSLVLQACGRGIRSESDRCSFVLLDRRYDSGKGNYDWRGYLNPLPYNVRQPRRSVENFHSSESFQSDAEWDSAILAACQGE